MMVPGKIYELTEPSINKAMGWMMPRGTRLRCIALEGQRTAWVTILPAAKMAFKVTNAGRNVLRLKEVDTINQKASETN